MLSSFWKLTFSGSSSVACAIAAVGKAVVSAIKSSSFFI
jgi:hypothetical protein